MGGDGIDNDYDAQLDEAEAVNETGNAEQADFCRTDTADTLSISAQFVSPELYGSVYEASLTGAVGPQSQVHASVG